MIVICPAVSAAVALISARAPNHERASPSPFRTTSGSSVCVACSVIASPLFVIDGQKRDRVAPGAVRTAAHHARALRGDDECEVVRLNDAPGVGDVDEVARPK